MLANANHVPGLRRLDLLLHREILRLRARYQLSLDEFRGLYISDEQVDALVHSDPGNPDLAQLDWRAEAAAKNARESLARDAAWAHTCRIYELSPLEQDVLFLALARDIEEKYETLYAYLNNDVTLREPTLGLVVRLLGRADALACRDCLAPASTLVAGGLVEFVARRDEASWLRRAFVVSPPLLNYLVGREPIDADLGTFVGAGAPASDAFDLGHDEDTRALAEPLRAAIGARRRVPTIAISGGADSGRESLARDLLAAGGRAFCVVDLTILCASSEELEQKLRRLALAVRLQGSGTLLLGFDDLPGQPEVRRRCKRVLRVLESTPGPVAIVGENADAFRELTREAYAIRMLRADRRGRQAHWRDALASFGLAADPGDLRATADLFQLEVGSIRAAAKVIHSRRLVSAESGPRIGRAWLFEAAKLQSYVGIGELAEKIDTDFELDMLVLPDPVLGRVREIIQAVRHRGTVLDEWGMARRMGAARGVAAMFAGASGTGKTMAASVVANELGLDLYRIELAGVVSKYIGETEKNLERVFEAARKANCALLFDEADALFGKRSEVRDAHDRYANIECAYLLQRMESHDGIVLLTTNLPSSIDPSFSRRLHFVVEFPRPNVEMRRRLWRRMFADHVPLAGDLDFDFLARQFESSGGEIKNMALDAMTLGAAKDPPRIDMEVLVRAAARQLVKQGRVPTAVEFKHYFGLLDSERRLERRTDGDR